MSDCVNRKMAGVSVVQGPTQNNLGNFARPVPHRGLILMSNT